MVITQTSVKQRPVENRGYRKTLLHDDTDTNVACLIQYFMKLALVTFLYILYLNF